MFDPLAETNESAERIDYAGPSISRQSQEGVGSRIRPPSKLATQE
jgi:hypothetical protein